MGPPGGAHTEPSGAVGWGGGPPGRGAGGAAGCRGVSGGQLAMPAGHRRAGVVGASRLHSPPA